MRREREEAWGQPFQRRCSSRLSTGVLQRRMRSATVLRRRHPGASVGDGFGTRPRKCRGGICKPKRNRRVRNETGVKVLSVWMTIESWVQKVWDMTAPPATPEKSAAFSTGDLWNETKVTMTPERISRIYIRDLEDLYITIADYFRGRGGPSSMRLSDNSVKLLLYGVEVFDVSLPTSSREGISFQFEVSSSVRTQDFFDDRLGSVENTRRDIEEAFDVIDRFARLHLPDKYLAAWAYAADRS